MATSLEDQLTEAIRKTQPGEGDKRRAEDGKLSANRLAWTFVRHLKSIPDLKGLDVGDAWGILMPTITEWHRDAAAGISDPKLLPDLEEFEAEMVTCWLKARKGINENALSVAFQTAQKTPYRPDELGGKTGVVAAVCRSLAAMSEDGEFFLTQRDAAAACGSTAKGTGENQLNKLEHVHKLIRTVKRGDPKKRKATSYQWIGPIEMERHF